MKTVLSNNKQRNKISSKLIWLYLVVGLIIITLLNLEKNEPVETSWNSFKSEMLANDEVEKIQIINKDRVVIYLNNKGLKETRHQQNINHKSGPHYFFNIGSLAFFEHFLSTATTEFNITVPIEYISQTNYINTIIAWLFPILLILIFWYFISLRVHEMAMPHSNSNSILDASKRIFSKKDKRRLAFYTAGQITVNWFLKNTDEILSVSIISNGSLLEPNWVLNGSKQLLTQSYMNAKLCEALGGRAAEEMIYGESSSIAVNDLEKLTKQAYTMIAWYGMGDKLNHISYHNSINDTEQVHSEYIAQLIDQEVKSLIDNAYSIASSIVKKHKNELTELAELLLKKEEIFKKDIEVIFSKKLKKINPIKKVS